MDIQNIDINKITKSDLCNFTESELVYIYLTAFKIPQSYTIDNIEHQKILHTDFLEYIKETKCFLGKIKFINECRWWWCLIPDGTEPEQPESLPLFSYYSKPVTNIKPRVNINLLQLFEVVSNPKYFEKQTIEFRNIIDATAKANYKKTKFDYVTFSGIFEKRNSQSCLQPSGYLCLDFDHVKTDINELKTKLINDNNLDVQFMFVSPSGDGLKVVIPYDIQNTLIEIFDLLESYFLQVYDLQIDKTCKNIDRACFICYDREVFINPKILKQ